MYEKLKNKIVETYIKENNINMKKGKYNVSELTHDVNAILFQCLESYYFENHTKNEFVKSIDSNHNDYYYVITLPNAKSRKNKIKHKIKDDEFVFFENYLAENSKNAFSRLSNSHALERKVITMDITSALAVLKTIPLDEYPIVSDIFSHEYGMGNDEPLKKFPYDEPYSAKREIADIEHNKKMEQTIDALKKDALFNMLLTQDPIQQMLNLKNKNNIEFKKVDATIDDFTGITNLLKLEDNYNVMSTLMNHYSLNYFSQNRDKKYTAIVAHNDTEIAGITSIIDASTYHPYPEGLAAYVSYIEVSEQYYGRKLGVTLMMEAIQHAKDNDLILFRTPSSENGSTYIKEKINEIARTSDIILVSEFEREAAFNVIERNKDRPKSEIKEKLADVLNHVRSNYKELELNRHSVLTNIIKYIDDTHKENKDKNKTKFKSTI